MFETDPVVTQTIEVKSEFVLKVDFCLVCVHKPVSNFKFYLIVASFTKKIRLFCLIHNNLKVSLFFL